VASRRHRQSNTIPVASLYGMGQRSCNHCECDPFIAYEALALLNTFKTNIVRPTEMLQPEVRTGSLVCGHSLARSRAPMP
jgi:hypothetical protein